MHSLLRRQLRRLGIAETAHPSADQWAAMLACIDRTYTEADQDRYTLERSLAISSSEMQQLYDDLQRSTETQLAATVAILDAALEAGIDGVLVVDRERRVLRYNQRFAEIWRIPADILATRDDDALVASVLTTLRDPDEFMARVAELYEKPYESSREEIMLRDGRTLDRFSAPVLADGCAVGRVWFFRDVTREKHAEAEIKKANRFLDMIVDNIPDVIVVRDVQSNSIQRFNRAGEELFGIDRDHLAQLGAHPLLCELLESSHQGEREILTDRGRRWLDVKRIPLHADHELAIAADVTDRNRAHEILHRANEELERRVHERTLELSQANDDLRQQIDERLRTEAALRSAEDKLRVAQKMEAVGRLAGGIAHDFNNMLSVVLTGCTLLRESVEEEEDLEEIDQIALAAKRAARLTQQLLAFSRQQVLQPEPIDLNAVVRDVEGMLRRLIGEDIDMLVRTAPRSCPVLLDRSQLEQVLLNLAVNARDAMPAGGRLTFATRCEETTSGRHVCIEVQDTGIGMDAETQARIFEPFFSTKERGRGTGLGLATVYGIVHQSGGHIEVDSEPGGGARFIIRFPELTHEPCVTASSDYPADQPQGSETILLVEDEEMVRRAASSILQRRGYSVMAAGGGDEAIALVAHSRQRIDLVLTDVVMPGMSGCELVAQLAATHPDVPVVFMSGYPERKHRDDLLARGSFLAKPFTPGVLLAKVRSVLDGVCD